MVKIGQLECTGSVLLVHHFRLVHQDISQLSKFPNEFDGVKPLSHRLTSFHRCELENCTTFRKNYKKNQKSLIHSIIFFKATFSLIQACTNSLFFIANLLPV